MPIVRVVEEKRIFELSDGYEQYEGIKHLAGQVYLKGAHDGSWIRDLNGNLRTNGIPERMLEELSLPIYIQESEWRAPIICEVWSQNLGAPEPTSAIEAGFVICDSITGEYLAIKKLSSAGRYEEQFFRLAPTDVFAWGKEEPFVKVVSKDDFCLFVDEKSVVTRIQKSTSGAEVMKEI